MAEETRSTRPVVVQKYGGTSVATDRGREALAARVREARASGRDVVVVVSAMGRAGEPYATDTLLALVDGRPADRRERDLLASCGEIVSAVVVAHELRDAGIASRAMSGADAGILTDGRHGGAAILAIDPAELRAVLGEGVVPVVAGFQGSSATGAITTLGRGGSDTTACALGVALEAEAVEICTDVEGAMTADPRVCEGVRVLDAVSYEELFQMARHGAKVMHVAAAEAAMAGGVPVRIRSTFTSAPGTLVTFSEEIEARRTGVVATAVTHVGGLARVRATLPDDADDPTGAQAQMRIYRAMAEAGISLDMFTPLERILAFSLNAASLPQAQSVLDALGVPCALDEHLAKVTLVGAGMHGVPGVMARVAEYLSAAGIGILQVADSHTTISVLVAEDRAAEAVRVLHDGFGLGEG